MGNQKYRSNLEQLIRENGDDFASISRMLGKSASYIQQYLKRGSPRYLSLADRDALANFYGVSGFELGPAHERPIDDLSISARGDQYETIPRLDVEASAGAGAFVERDSDVAPFAVNARWLKEKGWRARELSIIRVKGDSMEPVLRDGDEIMVRRDDKEVMPRDGIYVLRLDDNLMVKRVSRRPDRKLSILSDNPAYPDWPAVAHADVEILGMVVWIGRAM